jgi:pimeloyl-ACP methyl ester carboxylesterase
MKGGPRRGRGDSDEAGPFTVQREIEDIAALVQVAGGQASLWGWSSGGALALRAVGAEIGVERLMVYDTPFMVDPDGKFPTRDYGERLDELLAAGDRSGAVKHFMRNAIGIPAPFVALMPLMPMWKGIKACAHTLGYDWAALGAHNMCGAPLQRDEWASVTCPTLVVHGSRSPSSLQSGSRALAAVLPNAELRMLPGQNHNVSAKAIVPVLGEFLLADRPATAPEREVPVAALSGPARASRPLPHPSGRVARLDREVRSCRSRPADVCPRPSSGLAPARRWRKMYPSTRAMRLAP